MPKVEILRNARDAWEMMPWQYGLPAKETVRAAAMDDPLIVMGYQPKKKDFVAFDGHATWLGFIVAF